LFKKKNNNQEQNNETPVNESASREKLKKVLKIVIPVVLLLLLLFIVLKVAFSDGHDVIFRKEGIESSRELSVTDTSKGVNGLLLTDQGMTVVAENEYLALSFSNKENLFMIKDKATGEIFRSYPEPIYETTLAEGETSDLAAYDLSTETGQFITSPVFVGYTKSGMDGGFVLGVNQMKHVKTVYFIENGIRLRYEMKELELEFSVEITIEGRDLVYRIPVDGIIEREGLENEQQDRRPLLTSLSVLPYLGAHRSGQEGYFVTPDGTGALTRFDVARVSNYNEYSKKVYGQDLTFDASDTPDYNNLLLTIGAYGIVENRKEDASNINRVSNSMLTSFIQSGDSNAELKISNPGIRNLPFYAIYFQYNYRNFYKLQISNSGTQYDMVVKDKQLGDVEQRITFDLSEKEEYSYVDVASTVRKKLLAQWKERYGIDLEMGGNGDSPILNLKMFMGAKNVFGGVLNQVKVMTDFDGVQNIYNELSESGASDLRLSLLGWQKGGYYWNVTSKLKPDSSFGGASGLEDLNKWAKDKDITLVLDNNLLIIYGSPSNGATFRNSVVKKANTFYLNYRISTTSGVYRMTDFYVLSPEYFDQELLDDLIKRLKKYGAANVDLQQLGDMLYSDYNEENPLYRVQAISKYVKWLQKYGENFDQVSVYGGNSYAIPYIDTILDIPVEKSSHIVLDEDIPFLQIVYHGLVNYYSAPVNNQDDETFYLLRSIEYGALMSYELTEEKTSALRYTYYNNLYRSEYSNLKEEIIQRYNDISEAVKPFIGLEITDHYRVDPQYDIFCTEYSDGTKVYVCYEADDITIEDAVSGNTLSFNGRSYQISQKGGK
jgi:hypothetical protein